MHAVEVEGESISPEEFSQDSGWIESHRRRGAQALAKLGLTNEEGTPPHSGGGCAADATRHRGRSHVSRYESQKKPRVPALPREDVKIILRPRDGLDLKRCSQALIKDCLLRAAQLKSEEVEDDTLRVNTLRNLLVVSTPSLQRAACYSKVETLTLGNKSHGISAYATPPEDSAKGVIHNIPDTDSADDITRSLVNRRNPTILQARRLGSSNTAIIVFEGVRVPHYVYYRGAEYRCFLHKKKHEVCDRCGRFGHRTDVCPTSPTTPPKICSTCGTRDPQDNHPCEPQCAVCGKGHKTGDKRCKQRYRVPYLLKKRHWDRERRKQLDTRNERKNGQEKGILKNIRDRSESFPRLALHTDGNPSGHTSRSRTPSRSASSRGNNVGGRVASRSPSHHRGQRRPSRSSSRQARHCSTATNQGKRRGTSSTRDHQSKKQHEVKTETSAGYKGRPQSRSASRGSQHRSRSHPRLTEDRTSGGSKQNSKVSWAAVVSHTAPLTFDRKDSPPLSNQEVHQAEITKIKQMLEIVIAENKALKAEIAKLKNPRVGTATSQQCSSEQKESIYAQTVPSKSTINDDMEVESPSVKRKAEDATVTPMPAPKKAVGPSFVTMEQLEEQLSDMNKTLADTLTGKFEALLTKFTENVGKQITALTARTSELEAALPRYPSGAGCAGPIKSTKPYARPASQDRTRTSFDNAPVKSHGTE